MILQRQKKKRKNRRRNKKEAVPFMGTRSFFVRKTDADRGRVVLFTYDRVCLDCQVIVGHEHSVHVEGIDQGEF